MVAAQPVFVSEAGYLPLSAAEVEERHELWDGELRAMSGSSPEHNDLLFTLRTALVAQLKGGPCRVFSESIRVRLADARYVYPDVVVACPPTFREEPRPPTLLDPVLVFEVMSQSTEDYDRGRNLRGYQALESVQQVVLVDSRVRSAEHHVRQRDGAWIFRSYKRGGIPLEGEKGTLDLDMLFDEAGVSPSDIGNGSRSRT